VYIVSTTPKLENISLKNDIINSLEVFKLYKGFNKCTVTL